MEFSHEKAIKRHIYFGGYCYWIRNDFASHNFSHIEIDSNTFINNTMQHYNLYFCTYQGRIKYMFQL